MPKTFSTPDRLFDRTWRPGHPFRPRVSASRRWGMGLLFVTLITIIGGYLYLTDASRVRAMAERYLSDLLGGPVKVGDATLSIFEGLRLDNVRLYVDNRNLPDSLLFSAHSFLIQYSPRALLTGKIDATRIVAVDPRVHITEDAQTGRRNYARLIESRPPTSMPSASAGMHLILPEIILRNAQVDYTRLRPDGSVLESSSISIEGQLTPIPESKIYRFSFQSRGRSTEIGPIVSGQMVMGTGKITASLQNFEFGPDVKTMLPLEVRDWWEQHGLSGRLDIPVLSYTPPTSPGAAPGYRVEIVLEGVKLAVHPEQWLGKAEHRTLAEMQAALDAMRIAGLNGRHETGFVDQLSQWLAPAPLNLRQVHGRFIFTDDQCIQIENLNGWLEEIPFKIAGKIMGYSPAAAAHVRIASSDLHDIEIPAAPRYLNSLPPGVREMYDHFKPHGVCRFSAEVDRPVAGVRPRISGELQILDGQFAFDKFPYPLRKVRGIVRVETDPQTGKQSLWMEHIRGQGVENGPNADRVVEINGSIGPFGPDARANITIVGHDIKSEPAMIAAFPPMTRKALTLFDAPGKGEFPKFAGDFVCKVHRRPGDEPNWFVDTDIHLDDASGSLVGFPYPMSGVNGDVKIHEDNLEMSNIAMTRKDGASLRIDGGVSWAHDPKTEPKLRPDIKVVAKNVPIDRDLLNALPPARRAWLEKLGAGGCFDLDGTIKSPSGPQAPSSELDLDLQIALHGGTLWPADGGTFAVSDVEGNLRLTNHRLTLADVHGKRGQADLSARGEISWPDERPSVVLQAQAKNLSLDPATYRVLPEPARRAWDQVRPEGTVDIALNFSGPVGSAAPAPATQPAGGGYEVVLTPRSFAATPVAVPYRLEHVAGTVTILPDKVIFKDLSAAHGDARVNFSGTGKLGGPQQSWDFALTGKDVPIDDDLRKAVPPALADVFKSMAMQGKIDFQFSRLHVAQAPRRDDASPTTHSAQRASDAPADVDFALNLTTRGASMDVGVPLADVNGSMKVSGASRAGKLASLSGQIDVDSLSLAGRSLTRLRAVMVKPPDRDQLTIGKMEAQLAGGSMAGQVDYGFSDAGPSRYAVDLRLRNADVQELAGEAEQGIQGQLSASLALEGTVNNPASRRGRGDVQVQGKQMYKIPLVLGLLQITNLALPITSPFTDASVRYSIDGMRVTFEQIELRSKEMLMQGYGHLDFDSKRVNMTFTTDSTTWPKLPLIGDLIQGARHELLQFHVRGTLQEPKVSARSMNTLTTTVDEVLKGDEKPSGSTNAMRKPK